METNKTSMTKIIYSPIEGATNRKFTQRLKFIIFLFGLLMAQSCGQKQEEAKDDLSTTDSNMITLTAAQFKAANITLGRIERRPMGTTLHVNGILDVPPQNLITIAAPMGGFVKYTKLLQGMKVQKG